MNTIFIIVGMNHKAIEPRSTNCRVDAPTTTPPRRHEEVITLHLLADDQRVQWPGDVATVGTTIRLRMTANYTRHFYAAQRKTVYRNSFQVVKLSVVDKLNIQGWPKVN